MHTPTQEYQFLHEAAIIEYKGVLFASWYNNAATELQQRTPIRGRRSYDHGKTWTDVEIIADDPTAKILYCPPVYGICDGKLYMFINEMVGADLMHALDLFVFDEEKDCFTKLWSQALPFKLNTNVYKLPNGKLMLPGRIGEMDGLPTTPAVLISDSGKIDAEWRLVKIAENDILPNNQRFVFPECSAIVCLDKTYMFCRDDNNCIPLVYISEDNCETWSSLMAHDIPFASSKIYSGTLSNGRNYVIGNIMPDRKKLAIFFTEANCMHFTTGYLLKGETSFGEYSGEQFSYPVAYEANGNLYVIYSAQMKKFGQDNCRGALLSILPIDL